MKLYQTAILVLCVVLLACPAKAQVEVARNQINSVSTAVPFLTIAPDSRASAMGDVGAATTPDVNALHWNPAKYVFAETDASIALSYSPWLRGLVNDMNLLYLTGYKQIDRMQAIAGSLRYFNMGDIEFTDTNGEHMKTGQPNEFALDAAYSRLFSDRFSMGLAFRYVRSDISNGLPSQSGTKAKAGNSFAADIAAYYHSTLTLFGKNAIWALGANISNIGNKMSYSNEQHKTFLPINLRLGGSFGIMLDNYNRLTLAADLNKLMVPTPPYYDRDGVIVHGKTSDVGIVQGMFQSFGDAPFGISEEIHEIAGGIGLEYLYREMFAVRTGYFSEHPTKGNRRYFTMGIGMQLRMLAFDFSYLVATYGQRNPLNNTLRFTISFNLGKERQRVVETTES